MSDVFFTSDWHLYHKKILEYCPHSRKGINSDQMSAMLLENIYEQTKSGDVIYNVGDVSFGTFEQTECALKSIKMMGVSHHLVYGNHDHNIRKSSILQGFFSSVGDMKTIKIGKNVFDLCHMKKTTWDMCRYGSIHIHGHSHSTYQQVFDKCLDVGIDTRASGDMKMYSLDAVLGIMKFCANGDHH